MMMMILEVVVINGNVPHLYLGCNKYVPEQLLRTALLINEVSD